MSAWLASRSKQDIAELMTDTEKMNFDTIVVIKQNTHLLELRKTLKFVVPRAYC